MRCICGGHVQKKQFIDDNVEDLSNKDNEDDDIWPDSTENELQKAISLFNSKKHVDLMQSILQMLKNRFNR